MKPSDQSFPLMPAPLARVNSLDTHLDTLMRFAMLLSDKVQLEEKSGEIYSTNLMALTVGRNPNWMGESRFHQAHAPINMIDSIFNRTLLPTSPLSDIQCLLDGYSLRLFYPLGLDPHIGRLPGNSEFLCIKSGRAPVKHHRKREGQYEGHFLSAFYRWIPRERIWHALDKMTRGGRDVLEYVPLIIDNESAYTTLASFHLAYASDRPGALAELQDHAFGLFSAAERTLFSLSPLARKALDDAVRKSQGLRRKPARARAYDYWLRNLRTSIIQLALLFAALDMEKMKSGNRHVLVEHIGMSIRWHEISQYHMRELCEQSSKQEKEKENHDGSVPRLGR